MSGMLKEVVYNLTEWNMTEDKTEDKPTSVQINYDVNGCSNCGVKSFLQKDFDVCPHCLGWDHEIVREVYD